MMIAKTCDGEKGKDIKTFCDKGQNSCYDTFTFTFSHLADAFIQSDLQLGNT